MALVVASCSPDPPTAAFYREVSDVGGVGRNVRGVRRRAAVRLVMAVVLPAMLVVLVAMLAMYSHHVSLVVNSCEPSPLRCCPPPACRPSRRCGCARLSVPVKSTEVPALSAATVMALVVASCSPDPPNRCSGCRRGSVTSPSTVVARVSSPPIALVLAVTFSLVVNGRPPSPLPCCPPQACHPSRRSGCARHPCQRSSPRCRPCPAAAVIAWVVASCFTRPTEPLFRIVREVGRGGVRRMFVAFVVVRPSRLVMAAPTLLRRRSGHRVARAPRPCRPS